MKQLQKIRPGILLMIIGGALSFIGGLSIYTFVQAEGHSYFSDDPEACVNCHVMDDQFEAWGHSSHANVATCNDCHSPHDTEFNKFFAKAVNGINHSAAFTFNTYEEVIMIKDFNIDIVNDSCEYCHGDLVHSIVDQDDDSLRCTHCHAGIGHPIRN